MSITSKLLGAFLGIGLCLVGAVLYFHLLHERGERHAFDQAAANLANRTLVNTLSESMATGHEGRDIQSLIAGTSAIPGHRRTAVMDLEGKAVWFSGTAKVSAHDRELIDAASATGSAARSVADGWVVVTLLPASRACLSCHAASGKWIGAVLTEAASDPRFTQARVTANVALVAATLAVIAFGMIGAWWSINRYLVRPLSDLGVGLQAVDPENWTGARFRSTGADEIQDLAAHLNAMLERLAESEGKYRLLVENMREGIWAFDPNGMTTFVNPRMGEMLGYSTQEMVGQPLFRFTDERGIERARRYLASCHDGIDGERDLDFIHKTGKRVSTILRTSLITDANGNRAGHIAVVEDITERKRAESEREVLEGELRQMQKLEAVGQLAGGIAHDFNNILAVINGRAEFALRRGGPAALEGPVRRDIELVRAGAVRAKALTEQLLTFSRKQVVQMQLLDVNAIVGGITEMMGRLIGEHITLVVRLDAAAQHVTADPTQLELVLINLAVNARDAMPDGGRLTIEVGNVDLSETFAASHPGVSPGPYVWVRVADTGTGMTPEVQTRIFEPFFTTKEPGRGTGLGLSTAYGIVTQHGGCITVASAPGQGTTFTVYLPRVDQAVAPRGEASAVTTAAGRAVTVLLVEDEEGVRDLAQELLMNAGYTVLAAAGGAMACELSTHWAGPIDLLLTDLVMPGLNGQALVKRLRSLRPEMKVLFMSGYPDQALVDEGTAVLKKPFAAETLVRTIEAVLSGSPPHADAR